MAMKDLESSFSSIVIFPDVKMLTSLFLRSSYVSRAHI